MKIKLTDQFYLKHVESDLYLSLGNDEMIC